METENVFYMVYREGGHPPAAKHFTYESAEREATRIARKHGVKTYILKAVTLIKVKEPPIEKVYI